MTIRPAAAVAFVIVTVASVLPAGAEPMFLSKQYTRCSSCHYSASGGGLLTSYGRSLSGQELSTFKRTSAPPTPEGNVSGEEAFLYGVFGDRLGPVALGISLRPSYIHYEFGTFSDSRNPLMNADVSAAYRSHGWTGYGEVGRKPDIGTEDAKAYSREHWVSYTAANGLGVKGGRFLPNYGVHFADHTSFNRSYLGFDKYDQVYGVEVSYTTDKSLFQVTASPGRAESIVDDDGESAFNTTGRVQFDFGPKVVVVGSGFYRAESDVEAQSGAVGGALGLAPLRRLTIWTEGDAYMQDEGTSFVFVNETSWEVVRGVWVKFTPQGRTGFDVVPGIVRVPGVFRWGIGASLFPRTHWNFTFNFYRDSIEDTDEALETFLAQVHIYL